MRVVAGRLKGRKLSTPEGRDIRPTSDRAREAVFNIIVHSGLSERPLDGATVIDVFAGTGALGIEALSHGAARCTFVENNRAALAALDGNLKACGLGASEARVLRTDALRLPQASEPADLAFLDPPYGQGLAAPALQALAALGWLKPGVLCVLELGRRDDVTPPAGFILLDERSYGAARMVFLQYHTTR
ncbi:MAG: 16S rRNA (guanine(966)-N(2))-methyltransferase RsmD [Alphaproteobacteria bacterium]|nr:16S rRNA (guanine(966)-N(2))-methyltransferase RsmD [Alphaproteobacteria bacterium]